MGRYDKALRTRAIPYRAVPYENYLYVSDVVSATQYGLDGAIRFCRPHGGQIISARLTINYVTPTTGGFFGRIARGTFDTDGVTPIIPGYNSDEAKADQQLIFGSPNEIYRGVQAVLYFDALDLTKIIPKPGDPDYNEDGFIICFLNQAKGGTDGVLWDFKLDCTVQLGEVKL